MDRRVRAAFTPTLSESGCGYYPPYINVSEDAVSGDVTVIVRSSEPEMGKSGATASITLSREKFDELLGELVKSRPSA